MYEQYRVCTANSAARRDCVAHFSCPRLCDPHGVFLLCKKQKTTNTLQGMSVVYIQSFSILSVIALHALCDSTLHLLQRPRITFLDKKVHLRRVSLSDTTGVHPCSIILMKSAPLSSVIQLTILYHIFLEM